MVSSLLIFGSCSRSELFAQNLSWRSPETELRNDLTLEQGGQQGPNPWPSSLAFLFSSANTFQDKQTVTSGSVSHPAAQIPSREALFWAVQQHIFRSSQLSSDRGKKQTKPPVPLLLDERFHCYWFRYMKFVGAQELKQFKGSTSRLSPGYFRPWTAYPFKCLQRHLALFLDSLGKWESDLRGLTNSAAPGLDGSSFVGQECCLH